MNKPITINLAHYKFKNVNVFVGEDYGKLVRKYSKVDELEWENYIVIKIPDTIFSVSPTFFIGFLQPTLIKLGRTLFKLRIHLEGNVTVAEQGFNEFIDRTVRELHGK